VVPSLTPLHIAVQRNNIDLAKDLLGHRQIDANKCDQASVNKCKIALPLQ
jgi:ankyrin repeat protein